MTTREEEVKSGWMGTGDLGAVPCRGRDWSIVAGPRGEELGHLSSRGKMRLEILFCDVRSSPSDILKAILITNL